MKASYAPYSKGVYSDGDCGNGKRFEIDTPIATLLAHCYYHHLASGTPWNDNVNNGAGYDIAARLKVIDGGTEGAQFILAHDGTYNWRVDFHPDKVEVLADYISEATQNYSIDLTDGYHVIEITVSGTSLSIDIDGTTRITGTLDDASASKFIQWGDVSTNENKGGEVHWDYMKYKCN